MSLVGSTLGKYQILAELGRGGMATVYKGYNPALERTVAIKLLPPEMAADRDFVARFRREAQTAAQLKHPNIVTIYDVEQEGDLHYIVMEFLPGRTLQEEIQIQGALSPNRVLEITRALADALDYAHRQHLTHRDVKPGNVMLAPDGHVTLMDFGIVKAAAGSQLTQDGARIGTPEYMSPEQAQGQEVDARSDVYSLGVVLYQMLTGQVPFQTASAHAVLYAHLFEPPQRPSQIVPALPQGVDKVVLRALAKRASQRFQTAGQLAAALEQALQTRVAGAEPRRPEPGLKLLAADGREFPLAGIVGLGRSPDNAVQITDNRVSRRHAQVRCEGSRCQICDLGSVNGTYVNDQRLVPNVPRSLVPGDRVRLGPECTLVVGVGKAATAARPSISSDSFRSTLRAMVWADKRRRALTLLGSLIALLAGVLCVTILLLSGGFGAKGAGQAKLLVANEIGQNIEFQMGTGSWTLPAGEQRVIRFAPGEYDYLILLENGELTEGHGTWHAGDNGVLRLVGR